MNPHNGEPYRTSCPPCTGECSLARPCPATEPPRPSRWALLAVAAAGLFVVVMVVVAFAWLVTDIGF